MTFFVIKVANTAVNSIPTAKIKIGSNKNWARASPEMLYITLNWYS